MEFLFVLANSTKMCYIYIVKGKILNNVFGLISAPIDKVKYLKEPFLKSTIKNFISGPGLNLADSINKHSIDTVIKLLE